MTVRSAIAFCIVQRIEWYAGRLQTIPLIEKIGYESWVLKLETECGLIKKNDELNDVYEYRGEIKMKGKIALIVLAIVSILMAPTLSMPHDRSASTARHFGMQLLANNLTEEEINNMTLGEFQEMRQRTKENATCQFKEQKQNQSDNGCPGTERLGCMRNNADRKDNSDRSGVFRGNTHNGHIGQGSLMFLRIDDLKLDKLNNMTLNQIEVLKQQRMEELNNMTLNQIKELQESKIQEQNNMTLSELRAKNQEFHQISMIMGFGHARAELMHRDEVGKDERGSMINQEEH